jgi:hypothetical protein
MDAAAERAGEQPAEDAPIGYGAPETPAPVFARSEPPAAIPERESRTRSTG